MMNELRYIRKTTGMTYRQIILDAFKKSVEVASKSSKHASDEALDDALNRFAIYVYCPICEEFFPWEGSTELRLKIGHYLEEGNFLPCPDCQSAMDEAD